MKHSRKISLQLNLRQEWYDTIPLRFLCKFFGSFFLGTNFGGAFETCKLRWFGARDSRTARDRKSPDLTFRLSKKSGALCPA